MTAPSHDPSLPHDVPTIDRPFVSEGDVDRVFPLVYEELRRLAHQHLRHEPTGHTLCTTDLVHQAYIQLSSSQPPQVSSRAHFLGIAAIAMRRILVDHARMHTALKRGGKRERLPLESVQLATEERAELLVALDDALAELRQLDERQARVVECRFFGGMSNEETALALDLSERTVKRDWTKARSWLYQALYDSKP